MPELTDRERAYLLAAHARSDHRTARRWLRGEEIRGELGQRFANVAAALNISRGAAAAHSEPPRAA